MEHFFAYQFIQHALITGTIVAIVAATLGNFVVAARQSLLSDILAHTSLAGVGLGIVLGVSPHMMAGVVAVAGSVVLWAMIRYNKGTTESMGMLFLTGGLAVALLLTHIAKDHTRSLESYLFGSILTITTTEMWVSIVLSVVIFAVLAIFYHRFIGIVFDPMYMRTRIAMSMLYEIVFMCLMGIVVAVSLKIIGGLLLGALLVIPALAAQVFTSQFRYNILWSIVFGVICVFSGIVASFYMDIPASSGIVLSLIGVFGVTSVLHKAKII